MPYPNASAPDSVRRILAIYITVGESWLRLGAAQIQRWMVGGRCDRVNPAYSIDSRSRR